MSDIIRRSDAIEALESNKSDWNDDYNKPIDKDIQTLKELPSAESVDVNDVTIHYKPYPSAEAVQGWIPCSERLPEKDELVLATVWNDVVIAWRNRYGRWESAEDMYEKGDVTAWMPLPEPYKGGDDA